VLNILLIVCAYFHINIYSCIRITDNIMKCLNIFLYVYDDVLLFVYQERARREIERTEVRFNRYMPRSDSTFFSYYH
jgi:hypothetical protein